MMDNSILRALAYTGYDVAYLKSIQKLYNKSYIASSLKKNASGGSVRALQAVLTAAGHSTTVDGSFGPATEKSVKAYQKAKKLTVDGICGEQTWTSLLNE
jgi:peptidoglycan hydrolase-like protein with peptidoglycan-binding domain